LWNPAGATLDEALAGLGIPDASLGIIGGPEVFALFLNLYDVFHLTRAPNVRLPGGRPVFPDVPERTPEDILAAHDLVAGPVEALDPAKGVTMVDWRR
jgi:dihydrofolate reductase